jgi:hypothetical protein
VPISDEEKRALEILFKKYGLEQGVDAFRSVVPKVLGRHEYYLFKPQLLQAGR